MTGPLSYHVETQEGITLKRHSDQLKRRYTDESSPGDNNGDTDECDDFPIANDAAPETPPPAPPFPAPPPCYRPTSSFITFKITQGSWTICMLSLKGEGCYIVRIITLFVLL